MTPLQNLHRIVGNLGKLIAAKGFKKLPKVQKIAKSGHTAWKRERYSKRAVVVAQLVERSLPTLEVRGSNPVIGKLLYRTFICLLSTVLKRRK